MTLFVDKAVEVIKVTWALWDESINQHCWCPCKKEECAKWSKEFQRENSSEPKVRWEAWGTPSTTAYHGTAGKHTALWELQLGQLQWPPHSPVILSFPSIHCPPAFQVLPAYPPEHQGTNRLTYSPASSLFTWGTARGFPEKSCLTGYTKKHMAQIASMYDEREGLGFPV